MKNKKLLDRIAQTPMPSGVKSETIEYIVQLERKVFGKERTIANLKEKVQKLSDYKKW